MQCFLVYQTDPESTDLVLLPYLKIDLSKQQKPLTF